MIPTTPHCPQCGARPPRHYSFCLSEEAIHQDHGYQRLTRPVFLDDEAGMKMNAGYLFVGLVLIALLCLGWWLGATYLWRQG